MGRESGQGLVDGIGLELAGETQHPFCFKENDIGNIDLFGGKKVFSFAKLFFIVPGEQSEYEVGINTEYGRTPWRPGQQPRSFLQLFLQLPCSGGRKPLL